MNYRTIIAFLGKKQMKDWITPSSEWILAKDFSHSDFTDEFKALDKIEAHFDAVRCKRFISLESMKFQFKAVNNGNFLFDSRVDSSSGWKLWYNPDLDIYFIITASAFAGWDKYEELLKDWISSMGRESADKLLAKMDAHIPVDQIGQPLA